MSGEMFSASIETRASIKTCSSNSPLKIRGARPARLPSLKLRRKQAEQILWQAGEL
jgi:hypothetical protein